ncbi:hypothetical protein ACSQ67_015161 [Phaseolus vulgaris]
MNARRDGRNNRVALFDGIEKGGIRASSLYSTSSHEIGELDNEQALDGLQDRVNLLKRVSLLLLATCPRFLVISFILTIDAPYNQLFILFQLLINISMFII